MLPIYQRPGHHGRLHPERHGPGRPPQGLRLRHHLRHQQRVRLRLPARQHEAGRAGATELPTRLPAVPAAPLNFAIIDEVDNILIDEARTPLIISGPAFSDVRRYAKANDIAVQLTELQKKDAGHVLRGQGEGAHLPPDRRGHPQGRGAGRRRELLHGRQHGMAAPDRQRAQGPSPLQARTSNYVVMRHPETERDEHHHRRRVHRPPDGRPAVVRRPAPGGRGQARAKASRSRKRRRRWPRSRCRTSSSSTRSSRA